MTEATMETTRPSAWRKMLGNTGVMIGGTLLAVIVAIAVLAPVLAPHDPLAQDLTRRLLPPFWHDRAVPEHILGTDHLGRDYLSRMIHGARVSLGVGLGVILVSGAIGITLGLLAGYFGGWIDMVISFAITTRLSLPIVLVALACFVATWPVGAWMRRRDRLTEPFEDEVEDHLTTGAHPHRHGEDCGHPAVQHGDHVDYLHDGHRHAPHERHYDEH